MQHSGASVEVRTNIASSLHGYVGKGPPGLGVLVPVQML